MKVKMVILSKILKIQNKKTFEQVKMIKIEIKVNERERKATLFRLVERE